MTPPAVPPAIAPIVLPVSLLVIGGRVVTVVAMDVGSVNCAVTDGCTVTVGVVADINCDDVADGCTVAVGVTPVKWLSVELR